MEWFRMGGGSVLGQDEDGDEAGGWGCGTQACPQHRMWSLGGKSLSQESPRDLGASPSSLLEPPALPHPPSSSSPPLIPSLLADLSLFT